MTVLCHGTFDCVHAGHVSFLHKVREKFPFHDIVVSITSDSACNRQLVLSEGERYNALYVLKGLGLINRIIRCNSTDGSEAIDKIKPQYYVKGEDYEATDEVLEREIELVKKYGGQFVVVKGDVIFSSTKLKRNNNDYRKIDHLNPVKVVRDFINKVKNIKITILGETIHDVFIPVYQIGHSAKASCASYALATKSEKDCGMQEGGALAIRNHLRKFTELYNLYSQDEKIIKTRYYDIDTGAIKFVCQSNPINYRNRRTYNYKHNEGILLIADFGHGFLNIRNVYADQPYVMVQSNSYNYGMNIADKYNGLHPRMVVLDRNEASLLIGSKIDDLSYKDDIMKLIGEKLPTTDKVILTMAKSGCVIATYGRNGEPELSFLDALSTNNIVDTIGAGDTFFTFASLADAIGMNDQEIIFIGSLAAAITTKWRGNLISITPESLLNGAKLCM